MPVDKASLAAFLKTYEPPAPTVAPDNDPATPVAAKPLQDFLKTYTPPPPGTAPTPPPPAAARKSTLLEVPTFSPPAPVPAAAPQPAEPEPLFWNRGLIPEFDSYMEGIQARPEFQAQLAKDRGRGLSNEEILEKILVGRGVKEALRRPLWAKDAPSTTEADPGLLYGQPTTGEAFTEAAIRSAQSVKGAAGGLLERQARQLELPPEDPAMTPEQAAALAKIRNIYAAGRPGAALPALSTAVEPHYREYVEKPAQSAIAAGQTLQEEARALASDLPRPDYAKDFWSGMTTDPFKTLAISGLENVGNLVVTMAASAVPVVGPALGMSAAWAQETGAAYSDAKAQGATEEEAQRISGYVGATNMIFEYLPAGRALRKLKGAETAAAKGFLRSLVEQAVSEGSTESVQELNQVLAEAFGMARSQGLSFEDVVKRVGEAGVAGLVLGGGSHVAVEGLTRLPGRAEARAAEPSENTLGAPRFEGLNGELEKLRATTSETVTAQEPRAPEPQSVQSETAAEEIVEPPAVVVNPPAEPGWSHPAVQRLAEAGVPLAAVKRRTPRWAVDDADAEARFRGFLRRHRGEEIAPEDLPFALEDLPLTRWDREGGPERIGTMWTIGDSVQYRRAEPPTGEKLGDKISDEGGDRVRTVMFTPRRPLVVVPSFEGARSFYEMEEALGKHAAEAGYDSVILAAAGRNEIMVLPGAKVTPRDSPAVKFAVEQGINLPPVIDYQQDSPAPLLQAAISRLSEMLRGSGRRLDLASLPTPPAQSAPTPDRRQDAATRRRVSEMTPEERDAALLTDKLTGLPNDRAWEEAGLDAKPFRAQFDADGLKWINDNVSHQAGSQLLKSLGEILGPLGGHRFGEGADEYHLAFDDEASMQAAVAQAQARFAESRLRYTLEDGTVYEVPVEASVGTGRTESEADAALRAAKAEREGRGERGRRGEAPPRLVVVPPAGREARTDPEGGGVDGGPEALAVEEVGAGGDGSAAVGTGAPASRPALPDALAEGGVDEQQADRVRRGGAEDAVPRQGASEPPESGSVLPSGTSAGDPPVLAARSAGAGVDEQRLQPNEEPLTNEQRVLRLARELNRRPKLPEIEKALGVPYTDARKLWQVTADWQNSAPEPPPQRVPDVTAPMGRDSVASWLSTQRRGKPGLQVRAEDDGGATLVFRDQSGRPLAGAEVIDDGGTMRVGYFASETSRGAAAARASLEIVKYLGRNGASLATDEQGLGLSPQADRALRHLVAGRDRLHPDAKRFVDRALGAYPGLAPPQGPSRNLPASATENVPSPARKLAEWIKDAIAGDSAPLSSYELYRAADSIFQGTQADGKYTPKDATDALELGINLAVAAAPDKYGAGLGVSFAEAKRRVLALEKLLDRIPTQTRRDKETESFQQFSTPPSLGYVTVWAAGITAQDIVGEPSAGTGSLAALAKAAGALEVFVNELSDRRVDLLKHPDLGFSRVFQENAEQLDNVLPSDVIPSVIVMNPPFSQTAGRMGDRKVLMAGANHVEQALKRLAPGGRAVAIVGGGREGQGGGMRMNSPTYKGWWNRIGKEYNVRANVGIPGKVYKKYGTSFPTRILVIDKTGPTPAGSTIEVGAEGLAQALQILDGVRNDRVQLRDGSAGVDGLGSAGAAAIRPSEPAAGGPSDPMPRPTLPGGVLATGPDGGAGRRADQRSAADLAIAPEGAVDAQPSAEPRSRRTPEAGEGAARPSQARHPATGAVGNGEPSPADERGGEESGDAGVDARPAPRSGDGDGDVALPGPRPGSGSRPRGAARKGEVAGGGTLREGTPERGSDAPGPADGQPDPEESGSGTVEIQDAGSAKGKKSAELSESIFESYKPQRLRIEGAKDHPGSLVESAAMAAIPPPRPTYTPKLPPKLVKDGELSLAQLEVPVYAGMAHSQNLPHVSGEAPVRRGYMVGDGTGVGKGREIAAVLLDNWRQGRQKSVWLSEKWSLLEDATRDWMDLGGKKGDLFSLKKVRADDSIETGSGILFATYDTLKGKPTQAAQKKAEEEGKTTKTRVAQIVEWLGKDWDGVLIFDEAHNMANATEQKGTRGKKEPAAKALAGIELQRLLPQARVLYVSATAATEVENLGYADRLGLWGRGTPFASRDEFVSKISEGGLAAMELVARDMKALGSYNARSLSFNDGTKEGTVRYESVVHELTPEQTEIYDELATGWQLVLTNIGEALKQTATNSDGKVDAASKAAALSAFWGSHQRFFNQVLTSMQMPSVLSQMDRDLKDGRSVVAQLINTNEASTSRQLAKLAEEEDLEQFDLTPRDQLMQFVERSFPTSQMEEYEDDDGNVQMRAALDSSGKPIENRKAVAMKEMLLDKLGSLRVPDGPLESLINHFGFEKVAEVTGRSRRVVRKGGRNVVESRGGTANQAETDAFNSGKKRILVFSAAGGTGRSYHASRTFKNQDQRAHYLLQAGWRADIAIQGFGRTHRTNQSVAPVYRPVSTDIAGHKRFVSTIARRLAQLGALTTGERQTAGSGIFSAKDNLESQYAKDALLVFFNDLRYGAVEGVEIGTFQDQTGLRLIDPKTGGLRTDLPPITQFLNRLLSMKVGEQARVFKAFEERLETVVESAAARGELDLGTETLRADSIDKAEERVVFTEPATGVETRYVKLRVGRKAKPLKFSEVKDGTRLGGRKPDNYVRNQKSGAVYALVDANNRTDQKTGAVIPQYRMANPKGETSYIDKSNMSRDRWEKLNEPEAKIAWDEAVEALPKMNYRDEHLITGLLLPIWDRLPSSRTKIYRVRTDEGETFLGRAIEADQIKSTLDALGASLEAPKLRPSEMAAKIMDGSASVRLANGWTIRRRRVSDEWRMEITGPNYDAARLLAQEGVFQERIQYSTRYFIPSGDKAAEVLGNVLETRAVAEIVESAGEKEDGVATLRQEYAEDEQSRDAEAREDSKLRKAQKGASEGGFIGGGKPPSPPAATPSPAAPEFGREEIENAFKLMQRGMGKGDASLLAKAKEAVRDLAASASRPFKRLPNDAEHAVAVDSLRRIGGAPEFAAEYASRELGRGLGNLDKNERDLFDRAMLVENLQAVSVNYPPGTRLPGGFTVEDLLRDRPAIDQAVADSERVQRAIGKVKDLWRGTREELAQAYSKIGMNPEFLFKQGDAYMHHQVLQYAKEQDMKAKAGGVRVPKGRGWQKKLQGSELLINMSYIEAQAPVLAQMKTDAIVAQQLARIQRKYDIKPKLQKEARQQTEDNIEADGPEGKRVSWRDLVPADHDLWQPDNSPVFFQAVSLIDAVAARVVAEGFAEVVPQDLRTVIAKGGQRAAWVMPSEIVETLNEYGSRMERLRTNPYLRKAMRGWKWWHLLSPRRAFKYLSRNMLGDSGKVVMGNPQSFAHLPRAASEIAGYLYDNAARPSKSLLEWMARGGLASGQFQQEVTRAEAERIAAMVKTSEFQGFLRQVKEGVSSGAGYVRWMRQNAAFLESLLRYSTYLDYQEQIAASPTGRPDNFGASIPEQVMALEDRDDRAYWLSNELLGAYDMVSELGQVIREKAIPFWSFQELNLRSTYRLLRNAVRDDRVSLAMANKVGRIAGITALKGSGYVALKVGRFLALAYALELILYAVNHTLFEDEEEDLPEEVRNSAHIVLGRTDTGEVRYFNRLSVFEEAREWFGLDDIGPGVMDYLAGRSSLIDTAKVMAGRPYSKLVNSLGPAKLLFELASGVTLFPDATRPRKIQDRRDHLAASMGVEHEFRAAAGLPDNAGGYAKSLPTIFFYEAEPGQAAYQDTLSVRNRWARKTNNWRDGWMESAKTEHLRNMKRALKFGQPELAEDFLAAFVAAGGTEKGLWQSVKMAHPLYGLNDEKEQALREWMTVREQEDLDKAIAYYETLVDITTKYVESDEAQSVLSQEP